MENLETRPSSEEIMNYDGVILIKPSGIEKETINLILNLCIRRNIVPIDYSKIKLTEKDVRELYPEEVDKDFFPEMVKHLTSDYSYAIGFSGNPEDIEKIKTEILPKWPLGIRGIFANWGTPTENLIKNIAHSPKPEEIQDQVKTFRKFFDESRNTKETLCERKNFIFTCGLSESGKSTFCKYLDSKGIPRVKIRKIFELLALDNGVPIEELDKWVKEKEKENPFALWEEFLHKLVEYSNEIGKDNIVLDTLWGGGLGFFVHMYKGCHLVHIDADRNKRVEYQSGRENIDNKEADSLLLGRDRKKIKSGVEHLFSVCDTTITNNGSMGEFQTKMDDYIAELTN
jgi:cytidylate kinase